MEVKTQSNNRIFLRLVEKYLEFIKEFVNPIIRVDKFTKPGILFLEEFDNVSATDAEFRPKIIKFSEKDLRLFEDIEKTSYLADYAYDRLCINKDFGLNTFIKISNDLVDLEADLLVKLGVMEFQN